MLSKVTECLEQNIRKQIYSKRPSNIRQMNRVQIFELKYENTKLLGYTKSNQVKVVLAGFASAYLYQVSIKLY